MADQPAGRARGQRGPLWFLADRDAFLRRFVLRTLLEPRRARRPLRWPQLRPIPSPRLRREG